MDMFWVMFNGTLVLVNLGIVLFVKNYLPSYLKKKGENLATKEDMSEITKSVEEVRAVYSSEIERLKSQLDLSSRKIQVHLDKVIYIHRVQFETEFTALSSIWSKLVDLKSKFSKVHVRIIPGGSYDDEARKFDEYYQALSLTNDECITIIDSQSPFISKNIYDELLKISLIVERELNEIYTERSFAFGKYTSSGKSYADLCKQIEYISEIMRDRLESLVVIPAHDI